ncbi:MAG: tetratricopeptide repeat protein, partial [Thermomicrobiales bacterium]|nr:tetratricopeptide repeat protein [Thermomicrobiales bacterium]
GPRDLPARLQTMRDAIAWSHDLLPPEEQILFRRLAVFSGGFTPEGSERVLGSERDDAAADTAAGHSPAHRLTPLPPALDAIGSLVDKSLVTVANDDDGESRYGMLETIREYGLERLAAAGEEAAARRAQAEWCLDLAEAAAAVLTGPDRVTLLRRLERELANLRQALSWAEATGETELAYRLVIALAPCWEVQGHLNEGVDWARRVLNMPGDVAPELRGAALNGSALLAFRRGSYERALDGANAALAIAARIGDDALTAGAMVVVGNVAFDRGELDEALRCWEGALARFRDRGDIDGIADTLSKVGLVLTGMGELDRAKPMLEESVALGRAMNRPVWVATSMGRLAFLDQLAGDLVSAERRLAEALPIQRQIFPISAVAMIRLGATVARDARNWPLAAARYRESLELRWHWGERRGVAESLAGIAELAVLTDRPDEAARLFGGIDALRQSIGVPAYRWEQRRLDQAMARARQRLGSGVFEMAFADGQGLSRAAVVALAIAVTRSIEAGSETIASEPVEAEHGVHLTARELEVLRCLAGGLSDREIAETLFISPRTVARHLHSIYRKLDVGSRSAATAFAHKQGLV